MATATVTLMFTDLVDSTALMSRVGEATAEALRREHFSVLRAAVDQRGGREVKNLGDGLMVVFASAADAVAAAVDIQRALERRNRRAVEPLWVRVGISLGDADVDGDDFFGVPVVQASRLCAKAAGGEVLCTDVVRLLTGSRVDAGFEPVGELDLKGLPEPVATSRVTWTNDAEADASVALPARLAAAVTDRFVGRPQEQERLAAAWKQATTGPQCRVVLVSGEPGIGKTTLTARLAARVQAEGAVVVYGRCDEDLGIPYQPWIEALTQLVAAVPDEVLTEHVTDRGGHLARLVPTVARRAGVEVPTGDGGDSERFVLLGCVADLLERASSEAPVLVVLDDLHWADRQTVQVLRHVATSALGSPVMIVGTFRDTDVADGDPMSDLLARFHRVDTVERIALRGLDDTDLLDLLERIAGHEMDDTGLGLRDAVLAETDGNPFFVNEVLRHLAETGAIYQNDQGRWVGDMDVRSVGLPVSVTEVVSRRVAALGADTHQLLTLASVIGRDFDVSTLAAATGLDELDVIDRCDAAVTSAILQPTAVVDRYTFTHALIERTLYDSMSASRRARAHRTIAETIETLHSDDPTRAAELAHHWTQAVQPADITKALHYAQLAGDRALQQLAPDDALHWYTRALELSDKTTVPLRRHIELLIGLGTAQRLTGRPEHRDALLDAAHLADQNDDVDLLVRAALANTRGFISSIGTVDTERVAMIDRALERLGPHRHAERARLLAQKCTEQAYGDTLDDLLHLADEAVDAARHSGDPAVLAETLARVCSPTVAPMALERRVAWSIEACQLADRLDDPAIRFLAYHQAHVCALEQGDLAGLRACLDVMDELSERLQDASRRWITAVHTVVLPVLAGHLDDAEQLAHTALTLGLDSGQPDALALYGTQLINIRARQGRLGELVPLIEQAAAANPNLPALQTALATACAEAGDHDRARRIFDDAVFQGFPAPENSNWSVLHYHWVDLAVRMGHRSAAEILHRRIAPFTGHLVTTTITANPILGHYSGKLEHLLGRYDHAEASFRHALNIHERLESPPLIAMTQTAWAAMLADRGRPGDHDHARTLAEHAAATAERGGYRGIERDAQTVLDRLAG